MDSQERADWLERLGARPIETGDWFLAALVWRFSPRPLRPPPPPSVCLSLSFSLHLSFPSSLSSPLLTSHSIAPVHFFFSPPETQIKQESTKQSFDSKNTTREEESLIEDKGRPREEEEKKSKASKGTHGKSEETKHESYVFLFFSRPLYLFFLAPPTLSLSKLFGREKHVSRTWKMLNPTSTTPPSQVVKPCKHWCCDQVNTQGTHTCRKAHARQICRDLAGSFYSLIRSYKKKKFLFSWIALCGLHAFFLLIYRKVKSKLPVFFFLENVIM